MILNNQTLFELNFKFLREIGPNVDVLESIKEFKVNLIKDMDKAVDKENYELASILRNYIEAPIDLIMNAKDLSDVQIVFMGLDIALKNMKNIPFDRKKEVKPNHKTYNCNNEVEPLYSKLEKIIPSKLDIQNEVFKIMDEVRKLNPDILKLFRHSIINAGRGVLNDDQLIILATYIDNKIKSK